MTTDDQPQCPYCEQPVNSTSALDPHPGVRHLEDDRKAATDALLAAGWKPPESEGDGATVPTSVVHGFHRMLRALKLEPERMLTPEEKIARQMQADEALRSEQAKVRELRQETELGRPNLEIF